MVELSLDCDSRSGVGLRLGLYLMGGLVVVMVVVVMVVVVVVMVSGGGGNECNFEQKNGKMHSQPQFDSHYRHHHHHHHHHHHDHHEQILTHHDHPQSPRGNGAYS